MLQSLLALPLGAGTEVALFLVLYWLSPMNAKQTALVVALISIAALVVFSLLSWPGADVLAMYIAVLALTAYLLGIVAHAREKQHADNRGGGRWFHWAPAVIVIFFVLLFALDGVLVVVSREGLPGPIADRLLPRTGVQQPVRSVFPGTVANDFQKKESMYNEHLAQVKRQQERGWQVNKGWLKTPLVGARVPFQVKVTESDGEPVRFAEVSGVFQRPSDSRLDQVFVMKEIQPGLYRVILALPEPGVWNLALKVQRGKQLHEVHASTSVQAARE